VCSCHVWYCSLVPPLSVPCSPQMTFDEAKFDPTLNGELYKSDRVKVSFHTASNIVNEALAAAPRAPTEPMDDQTLARCVMSCVVWCSVVWCARLVCVGFGHSRRLTLCVFSPPPPPYFLLVPFPTHLLLF